MKSNDVDDETKKKLFPFIEKHKKELKDIESIENKEFLEKF